MSVVQIRLRAPFLAQSKTMHIIFPLSNQTVTVRVTFRSNSSRMSLRISQGILTLSAPVGQSTKTIERFITEHQNWIEKHLGSASPSPPLEEGCIFSILGIDRILSLPRGTKGPRVELNDTHLICRSATPELSIPRFLRTHAHPVIEARAHLFAQKLGADFKSLQLKDTRSRWGSCSHQKNLNLHWKLIFAPIEIMDYVIAHEVCHLKEMNHSQDFWKLVSHLCPDYRKHRRWLKTHGHKIQGYFTS